MWLEHENRLEREVGRGAVGEVGGGRGRGGTGGQEPNHSGFVGLSAKVGTLSLSRDQRESVKTLSKDWPAHTYNYAAGYTWNVQGGGSTVRFREASQEGYTMVQNGGQDLGSWC